MPVRAGADVVVPERPGRRGRRQSRDESLLYYFRNFKFRASFVKRLCQLFLYFHQIGSCDPHFMSATKQLDQRNHAVLGERLAMILR